MCMYICLYVSDRARRRQRARRCSIIGVRRTERPDPSGADYMPGA